MEVIRFCDYDPKTGNFSEPYTEAEESARRCEEMFAPIREIFRKRDEGRNYTRIDRKTHNSRSSYRR